jgi:peptidoglycan/xylan/chitin deacetylase (PgdA/CDA1 family)
VATAEDAQETSPEADQRPPIRSSDLAVIDRASSSAASRVAKRTHVMGAKRAGYQIVGWSWMSWDFVWGKKGTGPRVARHLLANAAPGKICRHTRRPPQETRGRPAVRIEAAGLIIDQLRAEGYRFGTLCDLPESSKSHDQDQE